MISDKLENLDRIQYNVTYRGMKNCKAKLF